MEFSPSSTNSSASYSFPFAVPSRLLPPAFAELAILLTRVFSVSLSVRLALCEEGPVRALFLVLAFSPADFFDADLSFPSFALEVLLSDFRLASVALSFSTFVLPFVFVVFFFEETGQCG